MAKIVGSRCEANSVRLLQVALVPGLRPTMRHALARYASRVSDGGLTVETGWAHTITLRKDWHWLVEWSAINCHAGKLARRCSLRCGSSKRLPSVRIFFKARLRCKDRLSSCFTVLKDRASPSLRLMRSHVACVGSEVQFCALTMKFLAHGVWIFFSHRAISPCSMRQFART